MSGQKTKYIVIPRGTFTIAELGIFLNTFYRTDGEEAHFPLGKVPKDGFYIEHGVITKIKQMIPEWKKSFEFFSQEGEGKVRPYSIPPHKKCAIVKKAAADLDRIVKNANPKT